MMIFGSLFSGIGGFDLGLEQAGFECKWQVENDSDCNNILQEHWPKVQRYGDITTINPSELETVDLVCGGFPCQDVSVAGLRKGLAGKRSGLWFEFHRIVASLKPRWVVVENVPGLLSSNGGRDFAVILRGLVECGYGVAWRILDAQYFGVAQRRRRVFVVGSFGDGRATQVLFESEGGTWDSAPRRPSRQDIAFALAASTRGTGDGHGNAHNTTYVMVTPPLRANGGVTSSPTLNKNTCDLDFLVSSPLGCHHGRNDLDSMGAYIPAAFDTTQITSPGNYSQPQPGDPCHPLSESAHPPTVEQGDDSKFNPSGKGRSYIVRAGNYAGSLQGNGRHDAVAGRFGVRRLTPTECERLQGFPDGWTGGGQSDSIRYRQLGNAVAVPCAAWIGKRILMAQNTDSG